MSSTSNAAVPPWASASSSGATISSRRAKPTRRAVSRSSRRASSRASTGCCSVRTRRSSGESGSGSSSGTATTTSRSSSRPTRARLTAGAKRRRARGALRGPHAARREACGTGRSSRFRTRRDPRAERGGEARGAECAPGDRGGEALRPLGGGAGHPRRPGRPHRARVPQPGLRGEVRLSLRRVREPPVEGGDPRSSASTSRALAGRGAEHGARGAGRDCGGPVASLLALDPYVTDWLNLLARWLHVIAAIVWIGTSFYFIALDNHLRPPKREGDADEGIGGESWEVHGGGFYLVQKYRVAPRELPETLHWFKWEAYTTWLSGFALMIVLYYLNADTYLIGKSVADLTTGEAVAISIGLLAAAWLVYDLLCRVLASRPLVLTVVLFALITVAAWGIGHLFSARAMYLQVGAMLGTMMVGNVFFVIIPAHWELVRAKQAGREPDPAANERAKLRSVHNNYLTLPVVFTMLSNHFPFTYGHSYAWLILVALLVIGAWIRHFFNLRHLGRTVWWIPVSAALAIALLAVLIRPQSESATGTRVQFAAVARIVEQRCTACHSSHPTKVETAPRGIELDTPEEIKTQAQAIDQQAVQTRTMPLGNVTGMTRAERELLGRWIAQGAKIP